MQERSIACFRSLQRMTSKNCAVTPLHERLPALIPTRLRRAEPLSTQTLHDFPHVMFPQQPAQTRPVRFQSPS